MMVRGVIHASYGNETIFASNNYNKFLFSKDLENNLEEN
jgi:hypothetical protein